MTPPIDAGTRGDWVLRLVEWLEREGEESEYLSHKENWTPRLKRIAREFLCVGAMLGVAIGIWCGWLVWGSR